ncbi:MAG: Spy/CpxP family protein refolding chaperone [Scytonema sp. PMC 1069.18]|nr:Spy/CpxP family protein refolding chaperone [Scytonema sp. PMC 1069.18]MEC4882810.1 Spy/CpxP family protein refolding chaperone [Scytonema sp. PMC 1070.18]
MLVHRNTVLTVLFLSLTNIISWITPHQFISNYHKLRTSITHENFFSLHPHTPKPLNPHFQNTQVIYEALGFELGHLELIQVLNLTPQQQKQLEATLIKDREQMKQNQQALKQAVLQLYTLIEGTATLDQIRKQHHQVIQLQQHLENTHFEAVLSMREVLNPIQRKKLSEFLQQRWEKNTLSGQHLLLSAIS